jgi:hypothetical protein
MQLSEVMRRAAELHEAYHAAEAEWMYSLADPQTLPGAVVVSMAEMQAHPMPPETRDALLNFLHSQPVAVIYALASLREAATPYERWDFWKMYDQLQESYTKPEWMIKRLMGGRNLAAAFAKARKKLERRGQDVDTLLA